MSEKKKSALSWFLCVALVGCGLCVGFARGQQRQRVEVRNVQAEYSSLAVQP